MKRRGIAFCLCLAITLLTASCRPDSQRSPKISQKPLQSPPPDGWALYPSPAEDSDDWVCANQSRQEWRVLSEGEKVKIEACARNCDGRQDPLPFKTLPQNKDDNFIGDRNVLKVDDGWLVGFDAGEFGGSLWWFSEDGSRRQRIPGTNIKGFARTSSGVLVMSGLAHMGMDTGYVARLIEGRTSGQKLDLLVDLRAAPMAFTLESLNSVLIITSRGLVRVRTTGALEQLHSREYLTLYPNSIVVLPSGVIYVGMRHFITRLTPREKGYQEEWFVPQDCQQFELQSSECRCLASKTK